MSAEQQTNQDDAQRYLLDSLGSADAGNLTGQELFEVTDLLRENDSLLRGLTDPGRSAQDRQDLAQHLFQGRVSEPTLGVLRLMAGQHWGRSNRFSTTTENLGVQAVLDGARREGLLDQVEDELFALNQLAGAERELRIQLSDVGGADDTQRQQLVDQLVAGRVCQPTLTLLKRGVHISGRGHLMSTLRRYAVAAAEAKNTQLVTVATATPLSEDQRARLKNIIIRQVGRDVSLAITVEPDLIGGFRINYGDEAADSSIRSELGTAKRVLTR